MRLALLAAAQAGQAATEALRTPDFSASINFGSAVFGFVCFRHGSYLQFGADFLWIDVPSWGFACGLLLLALVEWQLFKLAVRAARWAWARARATQP